MAKSNSTDYCGSFTDDDSGIGLDHDYSSNDFNSSTSTLIESTPSYSSQTRITAPRFSSPLPPPPPPPSSHYVLPSITTIKKRHDVTPLIKFASDGVVERVRPSTMKNSKNGDFVLCQTNRGAFVAYRTPVVPQWITHLVQELEDQQQ